MDKPPKLYVYYVDGKPKVNDWFMNKSVRDFWKLSPFEQKRILNQWDDVEKFLANHQKMWE